MYSFLAHPSYRVEINSQNYSFPDHITYIAALIYFRDISYLIPHQTVYVTFSAGRRSCLDAAFLGCYHHVMNSKGYIIHGGSAVRKFQSPSSRATTVGSLYPLHIIKAYSPVACILPIPFFTQSICPLHTTNRSKMSITLMARSSLMSQVSSSHQIF